MAIQKDAFGNVVTTSSGNTITTTATNAVKSAGQIAVNSGTAIVGTVADGAIGVAAGVVGQAIAPVVQVAQQASQVYNLVTNPSLGGVLAFLGRGLPPFRNELAQFSSYSTIASLGCLTSLELNFPLSYRTLGPALQIIKSGGTGGKKVPTIFETDGQREFFIDDIEIINHTAPNPGTRLSNAMSIKFKVIEPYSMGQFYQNLKTAAAIAGHSNYLVAPYLLSIAFVGYDDEGNVSNPLFSQRHIPIRIAKTTMKVTEAGAVYMCEAVPYNEIALTNNTNEVKTDMQIKGKTVLEVLQSGVESLTSKLNAKETALVTAKQKPVEDVYIISFPPRDALAAVLGAAAPSMATVAGGATGALQALYETIVGKQQSVPQDKLQEKIQQAFPNAQVVPNALGQQLKTTAEASVNDIGSASIIPAGAGHGNGANPFTEAGFIEDPNNRGHFTKGRMLYDGETMTFTFRDGTSITDIIEEVVLSSDFARNINKQLPDAFGNINFFKIHTQVYDGGGLLSGLFTGDSPKIYVYRVVPYSVDASVISPPQTSVFDLLGKQSGAVKAYNYIFTGQNDDIINFDLTFNQSFFTTANATRSQFSIDNILGGARSFLRSDPQPATATNPGGSSVGLPGSSSEAGQNRDSRAPNNGTSVVSGGNGSSDRSTATARDLATNIINNTANDLLQVKLTIWGDPYYLSDAGLGNWLGITNPANSYITVDGSMNAINGQVPVVLNFRTPIDYSEKDGFVEYPLGGFLPVAMFSGTYTVTLVRNSIKDGKFTQELTLNRLRNQDLTLDKIGSALKGALSGVSDGFGKLVGLGTKENNIQTGGQTPDQWTVG